MNFSLKVIQLKKYVVNFFKYRVFEKYCSILYSFHVLAIK